MTIDHSKAKWYNCAHCDAGYPDQGCTCKPEIPSKEEMLEFAINLFKAHKCVRYVGCELCAEWLKFADKHNWTDRYPTEPNWRFDED